jgi:Flp pilus assembly protein TadG
MTRGQRGSAVVDFVLVLVVLLPLALTVMQLTLVLYVRNTVAAAASEAARYAATLGHTPADGPQRLREQLSGALSSRYADGVSAGRTTLDGAPAVEVTVQVKVPALGLGGPGVSFTVAGHAVVEHQ